MLGETFFHVSSRASKTKKSKTRRKTSGNRRVPTKKALLWHRPLLSLLKLGAWILAIASAGFLMWFSINAFSELQQFQIKSVEIDGHSRVRRAEITAFSGISKGDSLLELDLSSARERILEHPWVKEVSVRRRWPDAVVISIEEREVALMVSLPEIYYVDGEGDIFKRFSPGDDVDAPVLTGLSRESVSSKKGLEDLRTASIVLERVLGEGRWFSEGVSEIHIDADLGFSVVNNKGLRIHLGRDTKAALDVANRVWARLETKREKVREIWANTKKDAAKVPIRFAKMGGAESILWATR